MKQYLAYRILEIVQILVDKLLLQAIFESTGKKFWEIDPSMWDSINDTGLRYVFLCLVMSVKPSKSFSVNWLIISWCLVTDIQRLLNLFCVQWEFPVGCISFRIPNKTKRVV